MCCNGECSISKAVEGSSAAANVLGLLMGACWGCPCRATEERIHDLSQVPEGSKDLHFPTLYPQPLWNQFRLLLWRNFVAYWRDPAYNGTRFVFSLVMALLFGTILWQIGDER